MTVETGVTLIHNARVYTMDAARSTANALAYRDGSIVAVGDRDDLEGLRPAHRIDAGGRAIIPGLIDAHIHFLSYSNSLRRVNLEGLRDKEKALELIRERAQIAGPGNWVLGGGWNNFLWDPPLFPTRTDLDRAAPANPVVMYRKDLHSCWVNSLALQRASITRDTLDPPGAAIGRDESGEPNGMLYESAVNMISAAVEEEAVDAEEMIQAGFRELARFGLTGFHDCEGPDAMTAFQRLDGQGKLPLRIVILFAYNQLHNVTAAGMRTGFGSDRLRTGPVKIFSDGSLGSMTAEMLEPYEGQPQNRGIGTIPQREMEEAVVLAAQSGIASAIHAIGDAANRRVLDAFEKARSIENGAGGKLVHRIEHAQIVDPADVPRFAQLRIIASMQPIHATSDMNAAARLWGARRARYSYGWRLLLESGAHLAFGSDAPVETPNPFAGIHAAVTRQDADDLPAEGWYPEQRLTVEEAVRAYTVGAAASAPYLPGVTGTLAPGSVADFLLLDRDIFTCRPQEIKNVLPLATITGGDPVFDPNGLFA